MRTITIKILIVCIFLSTSTFSISQVGFFGCSIDSLFWNEIAFGCHRSPISQLDGYETIYPNTSLRILYDFWDQYWDKPYIINWTIIDSSLYLLDIPLISYDVKYGARPDCQELTLKNKTRYKTIEKLTGIKFAHPAFNVPDNFKSKINPNGVLPAKWFSGKLYIKPLAYIDRQYYELKTSDDVELSFYILTFENGKITNIDKRIIVDRTVLTAPRGFTL